MVKRRARESAAPVIHAPSVVMPGARVGVDTVIGAFCFIADGAIIGAGTRIQSHVSVWAGVKLGEDVFVGPAAAFTNVRHPRAAFPRSPAHGGTWEVTVVGDGSSIGANATLVAPVRIGLCAMIGAGAVVTGDVPDHAIVYGAPARIEGWACTCGETLVKQADRPLRAVCTQCARAFVPALASDGMREESTP